VEFEAEGNRAVQMEIQECKESQVIRTEAVEGSAVRSSGEDTTNDDHAGGDDDGGFTSEVVARQAVVYGQSFSPRRTWLRHEAAKGT